MSSIPISSYQRLVYYLCPGDPRNALRAPLKLRLALWQFRWHDGPPEHGFYGGVYHLLIGFLLTVGRRHCSFFFQHDMGCFPAASVVERVSHESCPTRLLRHRNGAGLVPSKADCERQVNL